MASYGGKLLLDSSSLWSDISSLPSFSIPLPFIFQEVKEFIDEENPRPTSSNGAYITMVGEETLLFFLLGFCFSNVEIDWWNGLRRNYEWRWEIMAIFACISKIRGCNYKITKDEKVCIYHIREEMRSVQLFSFSNIVSTNCKLQI